MPSSPDASRTSPAGFRGRRTPPRAVRLKGWSGAERMTGVDLPAPDQKRLERLNTLWRLAGDLPAGARLSRRLTWRFRKLIARLLGPQETFNAAVVEHINSTVELQRQLAHTLSAVDEVTRYRESLAAR